MKKMVVVFSMLVITLLCGISVFAADTDDSGKWEFEAYGDGVVLTGYNGSQTDVYVPSKISKGETEYSVLKLGDELFKGNTGLNSVTLGENITEIGTSAFEGATNLVCIVTPESLTTIGDKAFSGCTNFNSVILYDAVTNIGANAFTGCNKAVLWVNEGSAAHSFATTYGISFEFLNSEALPEIVVIDGIEYYVLNGKAVATSYDGSVKKIKIPTTVSGVPVTSFGTIFSGKDIVSLELPSTLKSIGANAFCECENLEKIIIPEGVTSIGKTAFSYCIALKDITFPASVTTMGHAVCKDNRSLREVTIKSDISSIPNEMFAGCASLENVILPGSISQISDKAFENCKNLCEIEFSEILTRIGRNAFYHCKKLESVVIPKSVSSLYTNSLCDTTVWIVEQDSYAHTFAVENDFLYFIEQNNEEPEFVVSEGIKFYIYNREANVVSVEESLTNVVIPEKITSYPVTNIGTVFYSNQNVKRVELPNTVTTLKTNAFYLCKNLTDIKWSKNLNYIGEHAFYNCLSLTNVYIEDVSSWCKITFADMYATPFVHGAKNLYVNNVLTQELVIPSDITVIKPYAFYNFQGINSIKLPSGLVEIKGAAFEKSSFTEITFPNTLEKIGRMAFLESKIQEIILPDSVTTVEDYAFKGSRVTKVIWSKNAKIINNSVFANSYLTEIYIPEGVEEVRDSAFSACRNLMEVTLPQTVTSIGRSSFANSGLSYIVLPKKLSSITTTSFSGSVLFFGYEGSYGQTFAQENNIEFCVLLAGEEPKIIHFEGLFYCIIDGEAIAIKADANLTQVTIPNKVENYSVTKLEGTFRDHTNIRSVIIPNSVTLIGDYTFYGAYSLKSITIPNSVTSIGKYAFSYILDLKRIELPDSITNIGENAFYVCRGLEYVKFPQNITTIPNGAFRECWSLKEIVIPSKITQIGAYAFQACKAVERIVFPEEGPLSIGTYAFNELSSLKSLTIPGNVVLGDGSFYGCGFSELTLCEGITKISGSTFGACNSLKKINFPTTLTELTGFPYCDGLERITIPSHIKEIKNYAFNECDNLQHVSIEEGVVSIGGAFTNCDKLKTIKIPASTVEIAPSISSMDVIWLVRENSYAHNRAQETGRLYFILRHTDNLEISYGKGISGTIQYTDGTKASGTTVEILYDDGIVKETVETDENGNYEFIYAEVGRYTIRATDLNGNTASEIVSVKRMNVFDVYLAGETDLVLKKGYIVSGTVSPQAAKVTISDTNGNVIKSIDVTDGTFAFSDIPRGSYIVKAENENGSEAIEIYVSNEDVTGINFAIKPQSATITGDTKIENRDGTHSAKIWVNIDLIDENGNVVASTKTDAEGKYTFNNVPVGSYNIVALANEMRPDIIGGFDKNHELKGYGHIDVTEFITYSIDTIILREDKVNLTSVSGKVTANGTTQDCQVILTNENGDQIAVFVTDNNGKYNFINIPDGMYCITAITKNDGMGFAVITVENGVVYGDTGIKVAKADKISKREGTLLSIPDCNTKAEALLYREAVLSEKAFYDSLSEKERKQLSEEWTEKLFKLIGLISDTSIVSTEGVTVENVESIISSEEIDETIAFSITVTETTAIDAGEDGITSEEEYETEKIKDKKGKNKNIAKYYDITLTKDGQNISNIQKQTETNGKLRITMNIPEEYRGHKHYSFIHMHKGEAVTLVDLDDNPDTVTFEIDKFSTFALAYSDVELVGEVEETIYPASITYNAETGKILVSSTETGKLYIATYNGERLSSVVSYDVVANASANDYYFNSNQAAYVWNENLKPLCEKFVIGN